MAADAGEVLAWLNEARTAQGKPDARRVAVCNDGMGVVVGQEVTTSLRLPPRPVQAALGAQ